MGTNRSCLFLCKIQCTSDICIVKEEKAVFKLYNKCDHSSILSIKRYRHIKLYKPEGQDRRGTHLIDIKNVPVYRSRVKAKVPCVRS